MRPPAIIVLAGLAAGCGRLAFDEAISDAARDSWLDADVDPRLGPCPGALIFDDDFDVAGPGPVFRISSASSPIPVTEAGGELAIDLAGPFTGSSYNGYRTVATYPLAGLCIVADVSRMPTGNSTSGYFKIFDTTHVAEHFLFNDPAPQLSVRTQINASTGSGDVDHFVDYAYDAAAHRFWRLHHVGATTYWDASPDGIQFVELTRLDNLFVDATVFVELGAGHQLAVTNGGTAGFARITASGP